MTALPANKTDPPQPLSGCLARIAWMWVGNLVLVAVALSIMRAPRWTLTARDALFWAVVAAALALRWLDVTRLGGRTADGKPATRAHWVRYALSVAALSGLLWAAAHSVHI